LSLAGTIERSEKHRRDEEIQAIEHGDANTTGTRKSVYEGLRGKIKPMPEEQIAKKNHERLAGTGLIAEADINQQDLTELGLWEDSEVINQQEAKEEIPEAVEKYGAELVVEEAVENLLDEFTERGIVYEDPGDNIGFFHRRAKAFDVYDDSAFEIYDERPENMSEADFHRFEQSAPTMYQKFAEDVANHSEQNREYVVEKVAESSQYLDEDLDSIIGFEEAFQFSR